MEFRERVDASYQGYIDEDRKREMSKREEENQVVALKLLRESEMESVLGLIDKLHLSEKLMEVRDYWGGGIIGQLHIGPEIVEARVDQRGNLVDAKKSGRWTDYMMSQAKAHHLSCGFGIRFDWLKSEPYLEDITRRKFGRYYTTHTYTDHMEEVWSTRQHFGWHDEVIGHKQFYELRKGATEWIDAAISYLGFFEREGSPLVEVSLIGSGLTDCSRKIEWPNIDLGDVETFVDTEIAKRCAWLKKYGRLPWQLVEKAKAEIAGIPPELRRGDWPEGLYE